MSFTFDDTDNAAVPRFPTDAGNGKDLSGCEHKVNQNRARLGRDVAHEPIGQFGGIPRGRRISELLQHNPIAALALPQAADHAGMILRSDKYLIAGMQRDSIDHVMEPFAYVACQRRGSSCEITISSTIHRRVQVSDRKEDLSGVDEIQAI